MEQTTETPSTQSNASFNSLADVLSAALDGAPSATETPSSPKSETLPKAPEPQAQPVNQQAPKQDAAKPVAEEKPFLTPKSILDKLTGEQPQPKPEADPNTQAPKTEESPEKAPENLNPAAQTAFAKLTKELREAKSRLKEMESKISDRTDAVEQKGGDVETDHQLKELQTRLEQFQNEREELENELRLSRVEATREYKTNIGDPMRQARQAISDIAKAYEMRDTAIMEEIGRAHV